MKERLREYWEYDKALVILPAIVILSILLFFGIVIQQTMYENSHTCVKSHVEMTYPTYVTTGNVMTPIGGGPETVCDVWVSKYSN